MLAASCYLWNTYRKYISRLGHCWKDLRTKLWASLSWKFKLLTTHDKKAWMMIFHILEFFIFLIFVSTFCFKDTCLFWLVICWHSKINISPNLTLQNLPCLYTTSRERQSVYLVISTEIFCLVFMGNAISNLPFGSCQMGGIGYAWFHICNGHQSLQGIRFHFY